uniref:LSM domain-containing protein n=1 Tax=Timema genevievae TaxID=629358 RepID=A0A7R9K210_TIMGE|nr:unnamed protein product [Timema genevievae]
MKGESDSDIDSSSESCELDFTSTNFNASKVLRSASIQIPCPTAPIFDNIHSYASRHIHHRHASKQVKANSGEKPSTSGSQDVPQPTRRFLPHQGKGKLFPGGAESPTVPLLLLSTHTLYSVIVEELLSEPVLAPRKQRPERNLLTRMRNTLTGPLARLRDCTELRVRVKDKNSLTTRPSSDQGKNKFLPPVQGQNKVRTVLPPVQGQSKVRTRSYHPFRFRVVPPFLDQSKVRTMLPPVLDQSKVKTVFPPVQGQSKVRTESLNTRPGSEQDKNSLTTHPGSEQDKNSLTTHPGSKQDKNIVLPPFQGQSKVRTESYHQSRVRKNGAPGGRTSNQLTQTRRLRGQSRLDWLSKTGLESRSAVVKVVFPFSLHYGESKMYRRRSYIPEMVGLVARDNVMLVYIRNMKGIRGYCIAFVAAFDKHWNLALEDVTEVWTRPIKRKAVALGGTSTSFAPEHGVSRVTGCEEVLYLLAVTNCIGGPSPELQVQPSRVQVVKKDRRTETCERHVSQLMVRGEQVALIAILD